MACTSCGRGFHSECSTPCCCKSEFESIFTESPEEPSHKIGRKLKEDDELSISAGRKRAAEIYSINNKLPCEWQGKANCGGGLYPITGCISGKQENIHHGPVKSTYRNERSNIHLICSACHNRWHGVNDPHYKMDDKEAERKYELLPHRPREATMEELVDAA